MPNFGKYFFSGEKYVVKYFSPENRILCTLQIRHYIATSSLYAASNGELKWGRINLIKMLTILFMSSFILIILFDSNLVQSLAL